MSNPKFTRASIPVSHAVAAKWSQSVLCEGYVPMPKKFTRTLSQVIGDIRDLQVILAIVDFKRPNLTRQPSIDFLAFTSGLDVDTFRTRLREMNSRGWILTSGNEEELNVNIDPLLAKIEEAARKQDAQATQTQQTQQTQTKNGDLPF